ncbi:uncharacterized protein LOC144464461 [Epinephelus lanceolatus]
MKNLILVSLILQLVITVIDSNEELKFGDIIAFPRGCTGKNYKHYAIYVGPEHIVNVSQGDNDIFHRSGEADGKKDGGRKRKSGAKKDNVTCKFGKLSETEGHPGHKVENYFDGVGNFTKGTDDELKERIKSANNNCRDYRLFANNCEHLATWVRYNEAHSIQKGTMVKFLFSIVNALRNNNRAIEILRQVNENEEAETACATSGIS